jgi:hypothetical protein
LAALVATALPGVGAAARPSAVPATIDVTVTNDSGVDQPVYLYDLGTEPSSGHQGWADGTGAFHQWPAGSNPPSDAPDASITGPAAGKSMTIKMPKLSGRIYFSYGKKMSFKLAPGGLVQPAVQNPTDPNSDIDFNWSEFTLNDAGLYLNSTQVDMFGAPYAVGITGGDGKTQTTGHLKPGGYDAVLSALKAKPGWADLIKTRADGTVLRALAPGHGIESGALPADVMNGYIDKVWQKYATDTLTVTPFGDQPDKKFFGKVNGDKMDFTDGSGAVVTSFDKPDSDSVFGCYKKLDAPNDQVRGPISRTLCAAYNRTTLASNANQPDADDKGFYQNEPTNFYAKAIHDQMADGHAYAFAFDDVGHHESLVHDGDPTSAQLILDPKN